jgi:outer membrane protein OmpA-like peptidoglycan-associated protein
VGPADSLLAELSAAGAEPSRDDRGVSVALRNAFASDGSLTDAARAVLGRLSQVATTHPDFPVLLVGHAGSPVAPADSERRLATVSAELARLGVSRVEARDAGQRLPLLPDGIPSARERNDRIELVFVAPVL